MRVPVLTTAVAVYRVCFPLQDVEALRHVVELLDGYLDTFSSRWTVKKACFAGLPRRALDYLAAHGRDSEWGPVDDGTCWIATSAVKRGHLHVLQWINDNHPDSITWIGRYGLSLTEEAAQCGRLAIQKWLHANLREGCRAHAMDWAAFSGHLDVVQWLHEHRSEGCTSFAMDSAARFGHLEVVRFLHENRHEGCTSEAMRQAAANGHLEVVQWLYENRSEGHPGEALRSAARSGQVAVVEWLAGVVRGQHGGEDCIRDAAQEALRMGEIEVLKLLEQKPKRPRLK